MCLYVTEHRTEETESTDSDTAWCGTPGKGDLLTEAPCGWSTLIGLIPCGRPLGNLY